jgi:hypothetical protein
MVQDLTQQFKKKANVHIYLVIHNIDGPCFRTMKVLLTVCRLAC